MRGRRVGVGCDGRWEVQEGGVVNVALLLHRIILLLLEQHVLLQHVRLLMQCVCLLLLQCVRGLWEQQATQHTQCARQCCR